MRAFCSSEQFFYFALEKLAPRALAFFKGQAPAGKIKKFSACPLGSPVFFWPDTTAQCRAAATPQENLPMTATERNGQPQPFHPENKIDALPEDFSSAPIAMERAVAVLKDVERIFVSCEDDGPILYEVRFEYIAWMAYRQQCFQALARLTRRPRVPKKLRRYRRVQLYKIAGAFAGPRKAYEKRTRKICYARMMSALRQTFPEIDRNKAELLAGTALSRCQRSRYRVTGRALFKPSWDLATLREFLAYRWHELPTDEIETAADIDRHVLRHIDTLPLSCRRKVKQHVLSRRHFCLDYERPELLTALDCSFKYTGKVYAFAKARNIYLATLLPELFFRKAAQKIRLRQYAAWLRDDRDHFRDICRSLQDLPERNRTAFRGWAELERYSREWHDRQIAEAERRFARRNAIDARPFDLPPGLPRSLVQGGYTFTLLVSPQQMAEESTLMRHCIHSYARVVRQDRYLAFRVHGNDERATLGVRWFRHSWVFDQVRGKFNALVSDALTETCRELVIHLNRNVPGKVSGIWRLDGQKWHYIVGERSIAQIVPNSDELGRFPDIKWLTLVPDFDCGWHAVDFCDLDEAKTVIENWWLWLKEEEDAIEF
jgi:hypothetical protein